MDNSNSVLAALQNQKVCTRLCLSLHPTSARGSFLFEVFLTSAYFLFFYLVSLFSLECNKMGPQSKSGWARVTENRIYLEASQIYIEVFLGYYRIVTKF